MGASIILKTVINFISVRSSLELGADRFFLAVNEKAA